MSVIVLLVNSLRPRQNGRLFADDTFKRIFLNEDIRISTKKSLKFVPKGLINNIPALILIMAWRRPGDKPLSEPMLVSLLTHICVTRPQWVKYVMYKRESQIRSYLDQHFRSKNTFENVVCKLAARLSRSQCVNISFTVVLCSGISPWDEPTDRADYPRKGDFFRLMSRSRR